MSLSEEVGLGGAAGVAANISLAVQPDVDDSVSRTAIGASPSPSSAGSTYVGDPSANLMKCVQNMLMHSKNKLKSSFVDNGATCGAPRTR